MQALVAQCIQMTTTYQDTCIFTILEYPSIAVAVMRYAGTIPRR